MKYEAQSWCTIFYRSIIERPANTLQTLKLNQTGQQCSEFLTEQTTQPLPSQPERNELWPLTLKADNNSYDGKGGYLVLASAIEMFLYSFPFFIRQARRLAAADRSWHKIYGDIQYSGRIFPHNAQNGFILFPSF